MKDYFEDRNITISYAIPTGNISTYLDKKALQ
jgi:hypothetical protein